MATEQQTPDGADAGVDVADNLSHVVARIDAARKASTTPDGSSGERPVRLVAVSKTKPVELMQSAYAAGHRCFGENYVQEICEKMEKLSPSENYGDMEWHFIGHLQSNKVNQLLKGAFGSEGEFFHKRQFVLETIHSEKLATALNSGIEKLWEKSASCEETQEPPRLPVFIQLNSSGEESKNGITQEEVIPLARLICDKMPFLVLSGLMTIGAPDYSGCRTEDFELLRSCKVSLEKEFPAEKFHNGTLELSMGMSNDFETAIRGGSTSVRVGSSIFGARNYAKK